MVCTLSITYLLFKLLHVGVKFFAPLLTAVRQTWLRRGAAKGITWCPIAGFHKNIGAFCNCFRHPSGKQVTETQRFLPAYQDNICVFAFYFNISFPSFAWQPHRCMCVFLYLVPTDVELFTGEPHGWMMGSYIPCSQSGARNAIIVFTSVYFFFLLFLSLQALHWSIENSLKRKEKQKTKQKGESC